jgi:vacuolar-type H+-ATPase subunit H
MLGNLAKWFSTSPSPDSRPLQDAKAKTEIEVLDAQRKEAEAKAAAVLKEAEAKAAAVLKEAQAKAAAVLKEAEARTKEAQAKAKAEIELLDAQRKEAQAKAAAVLKEAEAKAALTLAPIVVGCAAAAFIGLDWLLFGCRPMLRWRMKRHLRALSRSPRYEIRNDIFAHDKLYERLECPELPIIFIGPSGSGKVIVRMQFSCFMHLTALFKQIHL